MESKSSRKALSFNVSASFIGGEVGNEEIDDTSPSKSLSKYK